MKSSFQNILASLARRILAKYKPKIIGITGSVGKTSSREAIFLLVSQSRRARRPVKNFNNEFGLPFAIIGVDSPGRSPILWLQVFGQALSLILFKARYPEILILEMGVDKPGDMDYLLSIAHPDIAVITNIGVSHFEFFKDVAGIEKEKGKLAAALSEKGTLVVNADNPAAERQRNKTKAKIISYSVGGKADVLLTNISESENFTTSFEVKTPTRQFPGTINAMGNVHLSAVVSALAVAEVLSLDEHSIKIGLAHYKPSPGRLNIIPGIKHTTIIDDTYNAAPDSMREALDLLERLPAQTKMAALGDMLELGSKTDAAHREVGHQAATLQLSHLVTVGHGGRLIADAAREAGMNDDKILSFDTADAAKKTVQELLKPDSDILIKGSQGVRMEKITAEIMAEPMSAPDLLCRQYGKWMD